MAHCPKCGEDGAYIGMVFVECANYECTQYTEKQRMHRIEVSLKQFTKDMEELSSKTFKPRDPEDTPVMDFGVHARLPNFGDLDLDLDIAFDKMKIGE